MRTVVTSRALLDEHARRAGVVPELFEGRWFAVVDDWRGFGPVTFQAVAR